MRASILAADLIVLLHLLFILFAAAGGLLVLRWPRLAWLHLPCAAWGVLIEATGGICPLTPLEQQLRLAGGDPGYSGSFIERYLLPLIYPPRSDPWAADRPRPCPPAGQPGRLHVCMATVQTAPPG